MQDLVMRKRDHAAKRAYSTQYERDHDPCRQDEHILFLHILCAGDWQGKQGLEAIVVFIVADRAKRVCHKHEAKIRHDKINRLAWYDKHPDEQDGCDI